jgi:hypothetical protein
MFKGWVLNSTHSPCGRPNFLRFFPLKIQYIRSYLSKMADSGGRSSLAGNAASNRAWGMGVCLL